GRGEQPVRQPVPGGKRLSLQIGPARAHLRHDQIDERAAGSHCDDARRRYREPPPPAVTLQKLAERREEGAADDRDEHRDDDDPELDHHEDEERDDTRYDENAPRPRPGEEHAARQVVVDWARVTLGAAAETEHHPFSLSASFQSYLTYAETGNYRSAAR